MNRIRCFLLLALVVALPAAGHAQSGPTLSLLGSSVQLPINLPGPLDGLLTVSFEDASNVSQANLGISMRPVSIFDFQLLNRLPLTTTLFNTLPVLVRIEPPAPGALSFTGVATVQFELPNLPLITPLLNALPLRLYAAPLGGPFQDISGPNRSVASSGAGYQTQSYRVIGSKGGFSEFIVLVDLTPLRSAVNQKMSRLSATLSEYSSQLPPALAAQLAGQLAAVQSDIQASAWEAAKSDLDTFEATVEQHSGTDIPDVWRAARDLDNVAGYLRAGANTLHFSIQKLEDQSP